MTKLTQLKNEKLTFNDFRRDPFGSYEKGFRLAWKHSIEHVIKFILINSWLQIFDLSLEIIIDHFIPALISLLKIFVTLLIIITMPVLFPLWVVLHHIDLSKKIDFYFGENSND
ncbi:MAG: hypothetical protein [Caudoviricetes sp.]|nr:MAG: hypothetical protein [Caudoviricetes sp.]